MNFMKNSKIYYGISLSVMLVGLIMYLTSGLNLGIDFSGGTIIQIQFPQKVELKLVEDSIAEFKLSPDVIYTGKNDEQVIIKTSQSLDNEARINVFNGVKAQFKLEDSAMISSEQFGPSIGNEIKNRALLSIVLSSVFMLIYITMRFEWRFGLAAIVALFHDVLILLSFYAIFRIPVNSAFIAAILTVLGYSINDTIVVFDRIRDTAKYAKTTNYEKIANESISQTLSRTINTSLTTLVVIIALAIFGASSVKELAIPLLVGISAGTYSSICIASPVWVSLKKAQKAALKAS